ncbi:MAG: 6-phosphogluconate dehydrogenase [Bacteroidota bacterium]
MKTIRNIILIVLIAGVGVLSYWYWGTYSEGVRSGIVVKVSKKGYLFKTVEGQLNIQTLGAVKGASPLNESFEFSVGSGDEEVFRELEAVSLSGERVSLHYIERFAIFPWRGETKYFVQKVERQAK